MEQQAASHHAMQVGDIDRCVLAWDMGHCDVELYCPLPVAVLVHYDLQSIHPDQMPARIDLSS